MLYEVITLGFETLVPPFQRTESGSTHGGRSASVGRTAHEASLPPARSGRPYSGDAACRAPPVAAAAGHARQIATTPATHVNSRIPRIFFV